MKFFQKEVIKMAIRFSDKYLGGLLGTNELGSIKEDTIRAAETLTGRTGAGNDFLGWLDLPVTYDKANIEHIKAAAEKIKSSCDVLIVIGIGGSYLGARAAIEFVHGAFYNNKKKDTPDIYFVGNDISSAHLQDILSICEEKDICINVISKSGTTTEPAIAFRIFRDLLIKKYGEDAIKDRIFVTTDKAKGALRSQVNEFGYDSFVVDDDIGGRYSVLSAVGLLPIAVSGADIDEMLAGAAKAYADFAGEDFETNDCLKYAAVRNLLYRGSKYRGAKSVEILAVNDPALTMTCEWWKQLFGESEGKDGKGIYPSSATYSTDLHSIGQFIQEGERVMFETVININNEDGFVVPTDKDDADGLGFLAGKSVNTVNQKAFLGTVLAHTDGGVPNIVLELDSRSAYDFGYLVYFFEKACAVSGYLLGVNPFNQPGVEAYKKNMFALLGKPGYEERKAELEKRISELG